MPDTHLGSRPPAFVMPSYSLTSDLLSFLRCGLQYRLSVVGRLPSSEPVQMWFGQFIHGVMEEAYRRHNQAADRGQALDWNDEEVDDVIALIERRLSAQGLHAWEEQGRLLGYDRARIAIRSLGPDLFPLIHRAEVRLTGSRRLQRPQVGGPNRYEMAGVVDVITHIEMARPELAANSLVKVIKGELSAILPAEFEVILDYKGTRRPPLGSGSNDFGQTYAWQVQTYAHLRSLQEDSRPVVAGVVLYLNELFPSHGDLNNLRRETAQGLADITAPPDSEAGRLLNSHEDATGERLPLAFRLSRAIKVYAISDVTMRDALDSFDGVVSRIEDCRSIERETGAILNAWEKNASDENTCSACDAQTFCPSYGRVRQPVLPGTSISSRRQPDLGR